MRGSNETFEFGVVVGVRQRVEEGMDLGVAVVVFILKTVLLVELVLDPFLLVTLELIKRKIFKESI